MDLDHPSRRGKPTDAGPQTASSLAQVGQVGGFRSEEQPAGRGTPDRTITRVLG